MPTFEIRSDEFRDAVVRIQRRAERQLLEERLSKCFVPTSVMQELRTDQNQLLFGRRGVGKTHTLKVFIAEKTLEGQLCCYIDCTQFGSGLGSDGSPRNVGVRFFSKLVHELSYRLLDHIVRGEKPLPGSQDRLQAVLEQLDSCAAPNTKGETFAYSEITRLLGLLLDGIGSSRLYIIVDEWAQIPQRAQPYFAEFVKRALFSNSRITMKIGVVDYAYRLCERLEDSTIGLEKSADIFSDIRMDSHFVWKEQQYRVEGFFAELLFNHLGLDIGCDLGVGADTKIEIIKRDLFTQDKSFSQLCMASEGNARDFLVIFARAHEAFRRQTSRQHIGLPDVQRASVEWYRQDKATNISTEEPLERFMWHLVDELIGKKKTHTFMVPFRDLEHPLLRRLFAARILHPLYTESSHPDKPGERYNLVFRQL